MTILGIDIGGSSIKYGLVHPGETPLLTHFDLVKIPFSSSPEAVHGGSCRCAAETPRL